MSRCYPHSLWRREKISNGIGSNKQDMVKEGNSIRVNMAVEDDSLIFVDKEQEEQIISLSDFFILHFKLL